MNDIPPLRGRTVGATRKLTSTTDELLRESGLDPEHFQMTNAWVKHPDVSVHIRPTGRPETEPLSVREIEDLLAGYEQPEHGTPNDSRALLVCISDQQVGKPDAGGTPELIKRFTCAVQAVAERITRETETGRVRLIVVAHLGDACEGAVSQGGKLRHDLGITEEVTVARRLLLDAVGVLAPRCERMVIGTVPSNHGEARRDQATDPLDNWCVEIVRQVEDAVRLAPAYSHIEFAYPESGEISLAVNAGTEETPLLVGMAHGHVGTRNPNQVVPWISGQLQHRTAPQPLSKCRVICTGHYHHFRFEDSGYGWYWLMSPALESGSDWFRHRTGKTAARGILTAWLADAPVPLDGISFGEIAAG